MVRCNDDENVKNVSVRVKRQKIVLWERFCHSTDGSGAPRLRLAGRARIASPTHPRQQFETSIAFESHLEVKYGNRHLTAEQNGSGKM